MKRKDNILIYYNHKFDKQLKCIRNLFFIYVFILPLFVSHSYAQSSQLVITDARLFGDEQQTRFVIDISQEVKPNIIFLDNPKRIVVELPEGDYRIPEGIGEKSLGLVSQFRFGLFFGGNSRFILDLRNAAKIIDQKIVPPRGKNAGHLVIDLEPESESQYLASVEKSAEEMRENKNDEFQSNDLVEIDNKFVVVIDPGHGGVDGGAVGSGGTKEKIVVLQAAQALKQELEKFPGIEVYLTRNKDVFIPLDIRVAIARRHKADLFVSLHADAFKQSQVRGASVYTVSDKASDSDAARLAARQNNSDIVAGVNLDEQEKPISNFLIDLMVRETRAFSGYFAEKSLTALSLVTSLHGKKPKSAAFRVLRAPDIPSVLVEMGYISNPTDERLLKSAEWRSDIAKQLANQIILYGKSTGHISQ